jgi:hypothetical protein
MRTCAELTVKIHTQKTAGRNTTGSDRQVGYNKENTSLAHGNQITREIQWQGKKSWLAPLHRMA